MNDPITRRRLLAGGLFLLASLALPLTAAPAAAQAPGFDDAVRLFQQAQAGADAGRARDAFAALAKTDPSQPLYAAYEGAAGAMMGGQAWMPWNKLRHTEAGLERIDQALALLKPEHDRQAVGGTPSAFATRVVAANTFLAVPDALFHRRAAGRKLLAQLQATPGLATAPAPARAAVLLVAARAARAEDRAADEQHALTEALALVPEGFDAGQARKRLKEIAK
ncbi:MAG TPA: hypothetical protein PKD29_07605 [Rhodocyclaceae bacterium]|nr:hypothetical protein [Rhodocyclaceae bacterium]